MESNFFIVRLVKRTLQQIKYNLNNKNKPFTKRKYMDVCRWCRPRDFHISN